jgi:hypothetical protein
MSATLPQASWTRQVAVERPDAAIGLRSPAEVTRFFDGLDLLEPCLVPVNHWRPAPDGPEPQLTLPCYAAVGRSR